VAIRAGAEAGADAQALDAGDWKSLQDICD
jgi:hypothetical protein